MTRIRNHPAEIGGGVTTAVAMLIAKLIGTDDADTIAYLAIVLAWVPAAITWLANTIRGRQQA